MFVSSRGRFNCAVVPGFRRFQQGLPRLDELQAIADTNRRLVVATEVPMPGKRNGCQPLTESGVDRAHRDAPTVAAGGHQGTGTPDPRRMA
ncbi:hypothetical protein [Streptomyces ochraceiscleroticus]|uniref:Uncharacterized protein n=1 Tax=Streptomyces ochraceiscleroticus TaxID=47761 RepID=A0ABW1MRL9_9ACTN